MLDTIEMYLARGGKIKTIGLDCRGRSISHFGSPTAQHISARRPNMQHDGKHLVLRGKSERVDTRLSRGNRPRSNSRDTSPNARQRAFIDSCKGMDGWSKPSSRGLNLG